MAVWRRRLIDLFPDLQYEVESGQSIYCLMGYLIDMAHTAHRGGNHAELKKIYGYANWCARQRAKDLWNSAYVQFFEQIFCDWELRNGIVEWLDPEIVVNCWPLWRLRLSDQQLRELEGLFEKRTSRKYAEAAI